MYPCYHKIWRQHLHGIKNKIKANTNKNVQCTVPFFWFTQTYVKMLYHCCYLVKMKLGVEWSEWNKENFASIFNLGK